MKRTKTAGVYLDIQALPRDRVLELAVPTKDDGRFKLVCKKIVSAHMEVHIRDESSLMLLNLKWPVTE